MKYFAGSCLALGALLPLGAPAADGASRPNILFILTDDLGWGDVGVFWQNGRRAAGLPAERTPQLDRMAAEGLRLTDHYSAAPVCAPSRASLLCGVDQGHAGVRDNQFDWALEDNHTLATVLHQAGYTTAAIGKWGLQGGGEGPTELPGPDWPAHPLHRGFDSYFGYMRHIDGHEHYPKEQIYFADQAALRGPARIWDNFTDVSAGLDKCYTTDLFTARAKRYIVNHTQEAGGQPFFLYLAFDTPHAAIELPTQAYPAGGGLTGGVQWLGQPGHMINTASGRVDSYAYPEFASARNDHGHAWPEGEVRYASAVRRIDEAVGDLLQLLRDLKIDRNTLVVFTSDNGPTAESYLPNRPHSPQFFAGYGPFDGIKRDCWEGGMREPTIVWWPGQVVAGTVSGFASGLWDWLPTLADVAGLPAPARADGVSLLPTLTGVGTQRPHDALYFEYFVTGRTPNFSDFSPDHRNRRRNQMQAIRLGDFVGVRYDIKSASDPFEIYNVAQDLKESVNLARRPEWAALQERMQETVIQSRRPNPPTPRPYDQEPMAAAGNPQNAKSGVRWHSYPGRFPWVPALEQITADTTGLADRPAAAVPGSGEGDGAVMFEGSLVAPAEGDYTFFLSTSAGAFLRLHDAAVIDADFGYTAGQVRRGTVKLKAGSHPFRLYYLRRAGQSPALNLEWQGPGMSRQAISVSAFRQP